MKMQKVHGSGNDFYILDEQNLDSKLTEEQLRELTKKVCDRTNGLNGGADGILYVQEGHNDTDGRMRVINADGSEASMCGNGIRTVARYLSEKKKLNNFKIQTMYADLQVKKSDDLADGVLAYDAEISPVSFKASDLGMHIGKDELIDGKIEKLSSTIKFSAVAVPNPHLIAFVDKETLEGETLGEIAGYLNDGKNEIFPDGVNVSFVHILDKKKIFVRTFERGVGYTNACGTAMSASSLMYYILYSDQVALEEKIVVINPGGMVNTIVHKNDDGNYWMSLIGNATVVANVEIDQEKALAADFSEYSWNETGEQEKYEKFISSIKE